jgi:hypothetical protein
MDKGQNEDTDTQAAQSTDGHGRIRRIGVQVPLYKKLLSKSSTQLSPDEYHDALERHRKYQEHLKRKWMTQKTF